MAHEPALSMLGGSKILILRALIMSCMVHSGTGGFGLSETYDSGFIDQFKTLNSKTWEVAEYEFRHPHFDTDWAKRNALFGVPSNGQSSGLLLKVQPQALASKTGNKFVGASVRRKEPTRYGRYEAKVRPAKGAGFVTGFFTYTGPHYGTQHDEIDIEFLGKNTRQIHVAWFEDGHLTNKFIDLPFDAADKPRLYAFEWLPDRINWYAEGTLIYTTRQTMSTLPSTPSRLFVNIWAADQSISVWSGKTKPNQFGDAWFGEIKFTPYTPLVSQEKQVALTTTGTTELAVLPSIE
jgi:beta-glucanase (GH16 family)